MIRIDSMKYTVVYYTKCINFVTKTNIIERTTNKLNKTISSIIIQIVGTGDVTHFVLYSRIASALN